LFEQLMGPPPDLMLDQRKRSEGGVETFRCWRLGPCSWEKAACFH
jgi:hypothetical protein